MGNARLKGRLKEEALIKSSVHHLNRITPKEKGSNCLASAVAGAVGSVLGCTNDERSGEDGEFDGR